MSDYLPEDLIIKILITLPAKTLMRFKCVSKQWRSLITNPVFAKMHFQLASALQTLTHGLLVCTSPDIPQLHSFVLEAPSFFDRSPPRNLAHPSRLTEAGLTVMLLGSCNGFVFTCVGRGRNFSIWNPTTGFFQDLLDPELPQDSGYSFSRLHGIGYVQQTDEYKVVVSKYTAFHLSKKTAASHTLKVLSLRDQNWREKTYPHTFVLHDETEGVGLHETLHWVVFDHQPGCIPQPYLLAFELRNEEFLTLQLPMASIGEYKGFGLLSWRGRLCLWVYPTWPAETVQCWVMEEYGGSWIRGYSFGVTNLPRWSRYLRPLLITENSKFILKYSIDYSSTMLQLAKFADQEEEEVVTFVCGWRDSRYGWGSLMIIYDETVFSSVMVGP